MVVKADEQREYVDFGVKNVESLRADEIREAILASGLWPSLIQRPYGIIANPSLKPKAIFMSAFNTAPLAADTDFVLGSEMSAIQTGLIALGKLTEGGVHVCIDGDKAASTPFHKLESAPLATSVSRSATSPPSARARPSGPSPR